MQAIHTNENGFTLPEVLMATIIIAISIVAMIETMALVTITDSDISKRMDAARIMYNYAQQYKQEPTVAFNYPNSVINVAPIVNTTTVTGLPIAIKTLNFRYMDAFGTERAKSVSVFLPTP